MKKLIYIIIGVLILKFTFPANYKVSENKTGYKYYINPLNSENLREMFRYTGDSVPFLIAHRGGPGKYFPENCIETFDYTLRHTYSLMEVDPRYTKDSAIILHHDITLERTTTGEGRVSDYTLDELKTLYLKDTWGNITPYRIPTLEKALKWARGKTILVLDKKDVRVEEILQIVELLNAESYTIIMAYTFAEAKTLFAMNSEIIMQVFISNREKVIEFDQTGIPWENVMVFTGHSLPDDPELFRMINQRGTLAIVGTHRNLDSYTINGTVSCNQKLKEDYNSIFRIGADIIETDIPVPLSSLIKERLSSQTYKSRFLINGDR